MRVSNLGPAAGDDEVFTTSTGANLTMGTVTLAEARALCARAGHMLGDVLLVVMSRDHSNRFHVFSTQLLPLYIALARFGMQNVRFKLVFYKDWASVKEVRPEYEAVFLGAFEAVSGGVPPEELVHLPDIVCAETAILGLEPELLYPFHLFHRLDFSGARSWVPRLFPGFVDWVLSAYRLSPVLSDEEVATTPGTVLIITRTAGQSRQMRGSSALAEHARQRGWHVQLMDISTLPIREQIRVFQTASILIGVHGAALTLAAFMPARAVMVELMPHGYGNSEHFDCYYCFSNWLEIAGISHVVWHDQRQAPGAERRSGCSKQAHVVLDSDAVVEVFSAAEKVWHTHPADRRTGKTWYLNEPQEC